MVQVEEIYPTGSMYGISYLYIGLIFTALRISLYPFSHNRGSGKLPQMKGNYYWRDPIFTSMIMGGSV